MKTLARLLATFFGTGLFPVAPGTFASFWAALIFKLLISGLSGSFQIGAIVVVFFVGVWASGRHAVAIGRKDPRPVVIDEVCGQWISLLAAPPTWGFAAAGAATLVRRPGATFQWCPSSVITVTDFRL